MTVTIQINGHSDPALAQVIGQGDLGFGRHFTDLMVCIKHNETQGWHDAKVMPFGPLSISPAAKFLHYGLEIFEGLKAYRQKSGDIALFRPELNAQRLNISAKRLGMPTIPESLQLHAMMTLVDKVRHFVPDAPATLYIRPALMGTEPTLGVAPSKEHLYFVIASPTGPYFPNGFQSISVHVEEERTRAAQGGVGFAKAGGNYAAGMLVKVEARANGFDDVIFLDAKEHRYIEELSAMNILVVENGTLKTPPTSETILNGVTRRSLLELAGTLGIAVKEEPVAIDTLISQIHKGEVTEVMAVGTAVIVTPIGILGYRGQRYSIGTGKPGPIAEQLYRSLTAIQHGHADDPFGWMVAVCPAA